jgi:predicted Zn-dependent peptidase
VRHLLVIAMSLVIAHTAAAAGGGTTPPGGPAAADPNVHVPAAERVTLGNGLRLVLVPRHELPLLAFELVIRGGARLDAAGREGTASLAADLLNHGAGRRDAYAFVDAVEGAGGSLDAGAGEESIRVRGQFLARDATLMLDLLADAVQRPRLDAAEFENLRERHVEELKAAKDSEPQALLPSYARALLFAGHPYGREAGGSEASLARVTHDDVRRYVAETFGADRAILVIAGDFDPKEMHRSVQQAFGDWHKATRALPPLPEPRPLHGRRVLLVDAPGSAQSYFWLGNVGVPRRYPQRAALLVANTAFGGSFGAMLNQALRVQAGLTYSASSSFGRGTVASDFSISSFTQTPRTGDAIQLAIATLDALHGTGLEAARIDSARRYLLGQFPLGFETAADWVHAFGELEFYGLPDTFYGQFGSDLLAANEAAVRTQVALRFPSSADLAIVVIGDAAKIRESLGAFGPVSELQLATPEFSAP